MILNGVVIFPDISENDSSGCDFSLELLRVYKNQIIFPIIPKFFVFCKRKKYYYDVMIT